MRFPDSSCCDGRMSVGGASCGRPHFLPVAHRSPAIRRQARSCSCFPMSTDDECFISWDIVTCFSALQLLSQYVHWTVWDIDSACPERMPWSRIGAGVKNCGLS
jgi:hypothetical protein